MKNTFTISKKYFKNIWFTPKKKTIENILNYSKTMSIVNSKVGDIIIASN